MLVRLRVDEDVCEEYLVEQLLEVVGGGGVHAVAVLEEVEGLVQVAANQGGVGLVALECVLDPGQLAADAVLLFLEQLQGDGSGVVGLEQAAALVLQLGASDSQGADVLLGAGLDVVQLLVQVGLDYPAVGGGQGEGAVEVAAPGGGVLHQQPTPAVAADGGGLQVVVVQALALAGVVRGQDVLDLLPGLCIHQCLVVSGVLHALEGDRAAVVGVAQQVLQPVGAQGPGGLARGSEEEVLGGVAQVVAQGETRLDPGQRGAWGEAPGLCHVVTIAQGGVEGRILNNVWLELNKIGMITRGPTHTRKHHVEPHHGGTAFVACLRTQNQVTRTTSAMLRSPPGSRPPGVQGQVRSAPSPPSP